MKKIISDSLKKELLSLPYGKNIKVSQITSLFTTHARREWNDKTNKYELKIIEPKFNLSDKVFLKANEYINTTDIETSVGRILFNKICIEKYIDKIIPGGFINEPITKKVYNKIKQYCSDNMTEYKITIEDFCNFQEAFEFYGLKCCAALSPSFTENIIMPNENIMQTKQKRIKDINIDEISLDEAVKIEESLVKDAAKINKGDPGMTLYDSGSRGSFDNDYKNISVMIGPIQNMKTNKYDIVTSNYMDGISKDEIYKVGNSVVAASLPRAVGTSIGGYLTKQFYSMFQSIVVEDDTDCGSKFTLDVYLDDKHINWYMYQYMMENGKPVLLSPDNADKYKGKVVKFRSPMGCKNQKICHICSGDRFRRYEIKNAGLTAGKVSNEMMQKQMKKFHEMKVKMHTIEDPNKLLI